MPITIATIGVPRWMKIEVIRMLSTSLKKNELEPQVGKAAKERNIVMLKTAGLTLGTK